MTAQNRIDVVLTQQAKTELDQAVTTLEANLSFLIGLSPEERQALPKMGVQGQDFVRNVLMSAGQNPTLIPAAIDVAGAQTDFQLVQDLTPILSRLTRLAEGISDTILEAGSEAFVTSLEAYDVLKRLGKGTDLDTSLKKMSRRFAKSSHTATPPAEEPKA